MSQNPTTSSNRGTIFIAAIVVTIIAILLAIYYLIPMDSHVLASGAGAHYKHAVAFGAVAILCIIGALVTRPKPVA
jgi:hypothetical protein